MIAGSYSAGSRKTRTSTEEQIVGDAAMPKGHLDRDL